MMFYPVQLQKVGDFFAINPYCMKPLPRLFGTMGRPRQPDEGAEVAFDGTRPADHPAPTRSVGHRPVSNLFLNTGHGTLGWTMAAGSGRVLADVISGRATEIESRDLGVARYYSPSSRRVCRANPAPALA